MSHAAPTSDQQTVPAPAGPTPSALADRLAIGDRSLRQHSARGVLINGAFLVALYSLGLIKGLIVASVLTRAEYGVWGVLIITLGTFLWLKQIGVSDKYVQQSEQDQEAAFQKAFTLELLVTAAFTALLLVAFPLLSLFAYGDRQLLLPGLALAALPAAGALSAPLWVFYRRMQFGRQRTLQAVEPLVSFVVTVALAYLGLGYWSLVVGALVGGWSAALVAIVASPYRLALCFERGTLREYAGFSWPVVVAGLSGIVIAQGSVLVGDHAVGLAGVGAISLAASLALYTDRVDEIVTTTLYPAICAMRDRRDLLLESFVKSNRLALMWGMTLGIGLLLFTPDLVSFGIGERWRPAVLLIELFGFNQAINHIGFNWTAYYQALGKTRPMAVVTTIVMVVFLAVPVPLLIVDGLDAYAIGMTAMTVVGLGARAFFVRRLFPDFGLLRYCVRALAPTVPAVAVVVGLRAVEHGGRTLGLALGEVGLYVAVTAIATVVVERALLREALGYLRAPARRTAPAVG